MSTGDALSSVEEVRAFVEGLGGVLTLAPGPGDGTPELAWGDLFFYEAPDGVLPPGQPFATVVTKDYPGEPASGLDGEGAFRVNVGAAAEELARWSAAAEDVPPTARDVVMPHPTYAAQGWLCVVEPGPASTAALRALLVSAHARARSRRERRAAARSGDG
ncbi:DUF6194 family protein [Microlunatus flavus]|uniref:DUF6194 domain-containing protein n=1 Tax=Microlunatus flavus TaxID=1036181 RepID=A0A1H9LA52_9ACTN|nr:DUF6194 family protein [Microlunatus flavus]SER08381.1 hypothetical protein SAMN05421756_108231 [Microlunatus flavus]